ncbi:MAG: nucleotidyltransferase family protein [Gemmatimonadota bacterium]|nr:nucleotidyltransferase family protein [Gemmatimonadota bacterium]
MIDTSTAQRLRRFRRSWNPRFLWPDMTGERFASAMAELARVTAALVDRPASRASIHDTAGDTRAISIAAFTAGIGPLLGYWMETGQLTASDATAEALATHLDHGRRRAKRLQSELDVLLRRFDNEGVPVTLLKGMHTAWVYFPEPGTRPVADIDLLIKRDALPAINRVLGGLGFTRGGRVRERETWRAPGPQVPLSLELTHCDNPWEVDLHLTLDRRMVGGVTASLGPVRPSDLRQWQVGPVDVHVLAQPLLAAYLAVHVSNHFEMASLLRLVELAQMLRADVQRATLDWTALAQRLNDSAATAFAFPSLELVERLVPGTLDPAFHARLREQTPPAVKQCVDRTDPASAMQLFQRSVEAKLMWLPSWQARARWFLRRLWPHDGDHLHSPMEAFRITLERVRRLVTGQMKWKRPS